MGIALRVLTKVALVSRSLRTINCIFVVVLNNLPFYPPLPFPYNLTSPSLSKRGTAPHGKDVLPAQLVYQHSGRHKELMASLTCWDGQELESTLRSAQMGDKETAGQSGLRLRGSPETAAPEAEAVMEAGLQVTVLSAPQCFPPDSHLLVLSFLKDDSELSSKFWDMNLRLMLVQFYPKPPSRITATPRTGILLQLGAVKITDWLMDFFFFRFIFSFKYTIIFLKHKDKSV